MSLFTTCIITTSSEAVATTYKQLIRKRVQHGIYPSEIDFRVYADKTPGSPGSGGAILLALNKYIGESGRNIGHEKTLLINAGGNYTSVPAFASEGSLFTPLPLSSSSTVSPVLLDLHLSLFLNYPWSEGELVICPDTIIASFDPLAIEQKRGDICGFAIPASFEAGSCHGVYKFDAFRSAVVNYFQKADPVTLRLKAAIEGTAECAVDTGIISLSSRFVNALLAASEIPLINGSLIHALSSGLASFDIYLEIITATLSGIDYETFQKMVSFKSKLDNTTLKNLFDIFCGFTLKAVLTRSATFFHIKTASDYLQACIELQRREIALFYNNDITELHPFSSPELISFNSHQINIPLGKHKPVLIESLNRCTIDNVLGNNILTGLTDWNFDGTIPEGICIEQRTVESKKIKIVYSIHDVFRPLSDISKLSFCGVNLQHWLSERKLQTADIWNEMEPQNLLHARLFVEDCSDEFLIGYWANPLGEQWTETFREMKRYSLEELNAFASALERDSHREGIRTEILKKQILAGKGWITTSIRDFEHAFGNNPPLQALRQIYQTTDDYLLKAYRKSLLEAVSDKIIDENNHGFSDESVTGESLIDQSENPISEKTIIAECPVRIDLAGGWTDLPPFTFKNGGAVVNFAVDLNGKLPVQVICRISKEPLIRLYSIDKGDSETIGSFEELEQGRGPSHFELHKAILRHIGFVQQRYDGTLTELLRKKGFGIQLNTFCTVPHGSGFGSSSILAAAILSALYKAFGRDIDSKVCLTQILGIEQKLKYGGGWQDLLGGVFGGVKFIQSKPGLYPEPLIYQLNCDSLMEKIRLGYFTLYYSGTLLRKPQSTEEVSRKMTRNIPSFLFTLNHMKALAVDTRTALETSDFKLMAETMNASQKANERILSTPYDQRVKSILKGSQKLYTAYKFPGAGGGGYALFLSETPQKAGLLREFLMTNSSAGAKIIPFSLNSNGLSVTVM